MQGELFTADVVRFPVDGRIYLVRRTARRLFEMEGEKAASNEFWTATCLQVKADAMKDGGTEADGQAAMDQFHAAVMEEMRRVAWDESRQEMA